jgi:hypothetical protein
MRFRGRQGEASRGPWAASQKARNLFGALALVASTAGAVVCATMSPAYAAFGQYIGQAQGFDSCTRPTVSQMNTWFASSPYWNYFLYTGGVNLGTGCTAPPGTSWFDSVTNGANQDWRIVFTWVGPQAPSSCNPGGGPYSSYISTNTTTAYNQGKAEGVSAYNKLVALNVNTLNAPVVYDVENYSGTTTCRNALKSFMKGWADQLALAPAQKSGAYGSACASYLDDFASDGNAPDFLWGGDQGTSKVTTSISCVSSTHWTNHQRHKQWKGGHSETWGGVTLRIDSDCSNGPVYGLAGDNDGTCT